MRITVGLLAAVTALGIVSCGGTLPPDQTGVNNLPNTPAADGVATVTTPKRATYQQPQHRADVGTSEGEAPAKDSRFTLYCDVVRGPNHVIRAQQLKDEMMRSTGLRSWHLIHTDAQSSLFFGYYRTFDDKEHDPREVARAQADARRISELKDGQGDRLFKSSMFVPLNEPDPEAPSAWNLANAPSDAYWSLQVAAYQGASERKQYAVDAVREMRAHGIEAFYFHGDTISSICIGAWPVDAVKRQDASTAASVDPNATLMVVGDTIGPISPDARDRDGRPLIVQAPKLEVLDPTMAKAIHANPNHYFNGELFGKKDRNGQEIPDPSFLVLVPHPEGTAPTPLADGQGGARSTASAGADQAADAIIERSTPAPSGYGRLPGLGR